VPDPAPDDTGPEDTGPAEPGASEPGAAETAAAETAAAETAAAETAAAETAAAETAATEPAATETVDGGTADGVTEAPAEPAEAAAPAPPPAAGPEPAGGRLTARVRDARVLLAPEPLAIPAPRSPEGVVPPPVLGRAVDPDAGLVEAVDALRGELARLEGAPTGPEQRALVRVLDLSATGVPDGGWSRGERIDAAALAGAAEVAGTLHASATALLERLDAEERAASAVEIDAVVTALQVARVVLDLESFARHGL
jgi:hypothetical protein